MSVNGEISIPPELQQAVTTEQAWQYMIVPKEMDEERLVLYGDPGRIGEDQQEEMEMLLGKEVRVEPCDPTLLKKALVRYYRRSGNNARRIDISTSETDELLTDLILQAKDLGSSDIHIEIYEDRARVRMRIDGVLVERYSFEKADHPPLVNKVKVWAKLDIAEKRLPQDGRIFFERDGEKFDLRISTLPTLHGEKVVLRLLSNDATQVDLPSLGFSKEELDTYMEGVRRPNGIVLISGPTGSGKTTTLYGTLKILNEEERNILTIEDPIEYTLEGINQVQLREKVGLDFASALRTFLRQDPDIIMLGEIRDGETARMAVRAALTGHLVLSTIHTNSAWGSISRLLDMEVPPFLLSNTLNSSVAQRLVRKVCPDCAEVLPLEEEALPPGFRPPRPLKEHAVPIGCENCHYTGYKGRKGIYEVIGMDDELSELVRSGDMNAEETLVEKGVRTLAANAFEALEKKETSLEEVYPLLMNDQF